MAPTALHQVPCPDCGQLFSARGLSGHRRLQHGIAAVPRAALPSPPTDDAISEAVSAIVGAIVGLQASVERIEKQLLQVQRQPVRLESRREIEARLEHDLAGVLTRIREVELVRSSSSADAMTEVDSELGRLRRDQARLVFRIDELRRGSPSDESLLI